MCYIQLSIRVNDKKINSDVDELIKLTAISEMESNENGTFVKVGGKEIRTLNRTEGINAIMDADTNGLMLHHRFATSGAVTANNVHGWTSGKWQFLHNGWCFGTDATAKGDSDSLIFFNALVQKLSKVKKDKAISNVIQSVATKLEFHGRAMLYDTEKNRAFLFGDFQCYFINENYIVITSKSQDFDSLKCPVRVAGLHFEEAKQIEFKVLEQELNGIYVLDNLGEANQKFTKLAKWDEPSYQTNANNRYAWAGDDDLYDEVGSAHTAKRVNVDIEEREIIDQHGSYILPDDENEGWYDKSGIFHFWGDTTSKALLGDGADTNEDLSFFINTDPEDMTPSEYDKYMEYIKDGTITLVQHADNAKAKVF